MNLWTIARRGWISQTYAETISRIGPHLRRTFTPRVIDWKNGFAGLVPSGRPDRLAFTCLSRPGAGGVDGRRRHQAQAGLRDGPALDRWGSTWWPCRSTTVFVRGAEPLFFLDYVAMSRDDPELTRPDRRGISDGCIEAECALLGGETAILPDFYKEGEYDLAGFCVGVVERKHILNGSEIRAGRQGDRAGQLGSSFERLQPGAKDRVRARRAVGRYVCPGAGQDGRG